jgi:HEAT repeat protein/lysophospholipase L1-like esterase
LGLEPEAAAARKTPPQSLAGNLLLSVAVLLVVVAVAEGLFRWRERPPGAQSSQSPRLVPPPSGSERGLYTMPSHATGWPPWEAFNRDGVRDRTHPVEKPAGAYRVICLGDSVTYGPDARAEDAYPQLLGSRLEALGPTVEVFNLALWGWSTRHERLAYESIGRKYRPDQVLLGICLNDVADLSAPVHPPRLLLALHRRSALVRWAIDAEGRQVRSIEELFEAPDSPRVHAGFGRLFDEIRLLRAAVDADAAKLHVLVFPFRPQLGPKPKAPTAQRRIESFCADEGIGFLDLLPELRDLGESAFEPDDGIHLSPAGNGRVAEAVLARIIPPELAAARAICRSIGVEDPRSLSEHIPGLIERLAAEDESVVREAAWALGRTGPAAAAAAPPLAAALGDPREVVRAAAAEALGGIGAGGAETLTGLLQALDDPRQAVRWSAARAIWRLAPARSEVEGPLAAAVTGRDLYVRSFAVWYLGELGQVGEEGLRALLAALQDPDPGLRGLAVRALGKAGAGWPEAVAGLRPLLASADWDDRWKAARALGRLGAAAAPAASDLEALLEDDSEKVRDEAARALQRIRD